MKRGVLLMCVLYALPGVASCAVDAQWLYEGRCLSCHGRDGTGSPAAALQLNVKLEDLNLKKPSPRFTDPEDIRTLIRNGRGRMPSFRKKVTPEKIDALIQYVQSLRSSGK